MSATVPPAAAPPIVTPLTYGDALGHARRIRSAAFDCDAANQVMALERAARHQAPRIGDLKQLLADVREFLAGHADVDDSDPDRNEPVQNPAMELMTRIDEAIKEAR